MGAATGYVDATKGDLWSKSFRIAWPSVLQAILVNFYGFNDFFFVARLDNPAATAALSACFAVFIIFYNLLGLFPTGALTLLSQRFGSGDPEGTANLLRQSIIAQLFASGAIAAGGFIFIDSIIAAANVNAKVGGLIKDYLLILFLAAPFKGLMLTGLNTFRAAGNTRMPLLLEGIGLVTNLLLNYLLVLGPGPFPSLGIEGAAWATAASRAAPALLGIWILVSGKAQLGFESHFRWSIHSLKNELAEVARMGRIGIFKSISGIIYGSVYFLLNRFAGVIGAAAQGGLGAGLRGVEWMGYAVASGFHKSTAAVVGQNKGAGNSDRVFKGVWINALMSGAGCQLIGTAFVLFPDFLVGLVASGPEVIGHGTYYVYYMGWFMWSVGVSIAVFGAMVGEGKTGKAMLIGASMNLARIPMALGFMFGTDKLPEALEWMVGLKETAPPLVGGFEGIVWAIILSAIGKAILYSGFYVYEFVLKGRREK
jgi:putative MATE family efflux protein